MLDATAPERTYYLDTTRLREVKKKLTHFQKNIGAIIVQRDRPARSDDPTPKRSPLGRRRWVA